MSKFRKDLLLLIALVALSMSVSNVFAVVTQYPHIPQLVSEDRVKIPASFRTNEGANGVEVVELDEGIRPQAHYFVNQGGRQIRKKIRAGDIITHVNGQPTKNVFELFKMLGHNGDHSVEIVSRGRTAGGTIQPRPVRCPKLFNPAPKAGARVFVVHIVDNKDETIGDKIETNIGLMKQLFQSNVEAKRIAQYVLISEKARGDNGEWEQQPENRRCNALNILNTVQGLSISENDTLFVYYQGHGGYSGKREHWNLDTSAGQIFKLDGDDLLRSALVRLMLAKNARMTILISDCCNSKSTFESDYVPRMRTASFVMEGWTKLESLLFCHAGFVDVTSASRGNMSWCTQEYGSWFTHTFISNLQGGGSGDEGAWPNVWSKVKDDSESFYEFRREQFINQNSAPRELVEQKRMPAHEYQLDIERQFPPDPPGRRQIPKLTKVAVYAARND